MAKIRKKKAAEQTANGERRFGRFVIFGIMFTVCIVYAQTASFEFTDWDDNKLIVDNAGIRSLSAESLRTMFTLESGRTFQPIRELSYAIDYALWELKPGPYHLVNALLHAIAAVLLFVWLRVLLRGFRPQWEPRQIGIAAAIAALLFAAHPVNIEAVAWASSRKYGLLAVFSLLAAICHQQSITATGVQRAGLIAGTLLCMLLAMWSSPVGVVVPTLLIGTDLCAAGIQRARKLRAQYAGYLALNVIITLSLFRVLTSGQGKTARDHSDGTLTGTLVTDFQVFFDYLCNLLLPLWLNNRYFHELSQSLSSPKVLLGMLSGAILVAAAVWRARHQDWFAAWCLGWFVVAWAPVANLVPISTIMADRYLYLPAMGVFAIAGAGGSALITRYGKGAMVAIGCVLLAYAAGGYQRCGVWKNSATLWTDSLAKDSRSALPYNSLGTLAQDAGRFGEAEAFYQQAIDRDPNSAVAHYNLSRILTLQSREHERAIRHIDLAIQADPLFANAHNNRGVLTKDLTSFQEAVRLAPDNADARKNLGNCYLERKQFDLARPQYEKALRLIPHDPSLHLYLGLIAQQAGDLAAAASRYEQALLLDPTLSAAQSRLTQIRASQN
ncbi:MAG TPA: hypothetical protein DCR55_17630 [Lentisphaeria bacterium]|nr:hypothetical protein [Lentisphaeria bacterium]